LQQLQCGPIVDVVHLSRHLIERPPQSIVTSIGSIYRIAAQSIEKVAV